MIDQAEILEFLKNNLSPNRYKHSVNVSTTAENLAERYGCDTYKAKIAGLVHDCAKGLEKDALIDCINKEGIAIDEVTLSVKELMHGPAAVHICRKNFDIQDADILNAVRYHTTGKENMSILEKVIYLSDFIEPTRDFAGVGTLRELAVQNLDRALLKAFDLSIEYVISKNGLIHTDTVLSRNYILQSLSKGRRDDSK
ncbi:MAG: bis(5'-nucleosyl)-tetraphosphatase (symmetrical) YqeK [Caulobacteraceae bacterium]